jgi:GT2 family glycosyltransferase
MDKNADLINMHPKIGVVIPTYKRANELIDCITSLYKESRKDFDVVVINDGGCENVSSLLRDKFPKCIEIKSADDLWWTKSVNKGLEYLIEKSCDAVILLNDDVTVSEGYIDKIIDNYILSKNTIIISRIVDRNGNVWAMGGRTKWPCHGPTHILENYSTSNRCGVVTWSPGMGTLIPIEALLDVGLLDSVSFPQYLSDTDFGLRASAKGWVFRINNECVIVNNTDSTGGLALKTKVKLSDLFFIFFNLRSSDYLPARLRFTYRHAPFGLRTIAVIIRIVKVCGFFLRRYF